MSLDEVLQILLIEARQRRITGTEAASTFDALGRVLAQGVDAGLDVPPADNSSMDGYALRVADLPAAGTVLAVSQRIPAGVVGTALQPGTAARIFTGAQVPEGADAIVMQEQCEAQLAEGGHGLGQVRVQTLPPAGQWIRRRGEDVQRGSQVLAAGVRLTPQALGLAASVGAASLAVCRRPRVALFSTGDELVMPGEPLKPGAIYNSNRFTLRGLIQALGCECNDLGIVPDRLDATREALRRAAQGNDLIVTSGGVSVGEEDHLKQAVRELGELHLWRLAIQPGKPFAFGRVCGTPWIGLPGNPVAALLTALVVARPFLLAAQGRSNVLPRALPLPAGFAWPKANARRQYLRARIEHQDGELRVVPHTQQGSAMLSAMSWAEGLAVVEAGRTLGAGEQVEFLALDTLLA